VQAICADGGYGYPAAAPFDRIILTVGAPDITPAWWKQMKPDGRLVLPLILRGSMKSIAFQPVDEHLVSLSVNDCGFISLRGDFASTLSSRVQIGPTSKLYVEPMEEFAVDSDAVYDLLTKPGKDWAADVEVTAWDILGGNLWTWLALHEPHMCKLVAEDEMVEKGLVPPVIGIDTKRKSSGTAVLLAKTGLAALTRPHDQPLAMIPFEKLFNPDSPATQPFALFVRQFGADESVPQRLLARIQAWKAGGCLSSNTMQIRAYPRDVDYRPVAGEILLEKPWTKLVVAWTAAA
jgi:protein-L-isoaspartate(D-aspartate) O-methyltransferase